MTDTEHKKYIEKLSRKISRISGIPIEEIQIKSTQCRWHPEDFDDTIYVGDILDVSADYSAYRQHGSFLVCGVPIYDELLMKYLWVCGELHNARAELSNQAKNSAQ